MESEISIIISGKLHLKPMVPVFTSLAGFTRNYSFQLPLLAYLDTTFPPLLSGLTILNVGFFCRPAAKLVD